MALDGGSRVVQAERKVLFHRFRLYRWAPNAARSAVADRLAGPWTELGNPAVDAGGDITYGAQGTFALQLAPDEIIFMADRWNPENAIDGRYLWLPVEWKAERPILREPAYQCLCRNLV